MITTRYHTSCSFIPEIRIQMLIWKFKVFLFLVVIGTIASIYISFLARSGFLKPTSKISGFHDAINGFHVITNYPLIVERPWKDNQTETNMTRLWERQAEVEETLQRNLDHPLVTILHLLINQESALKRLTELQLRNKQKIRVRRIKGLPKYRDFFAYVGEKLQNCTVSIMNMDIAIGEGFEQLNKTLLMTENISYVLTRNGRQERRCNMAGKQGYCGTGYIGSHDAFIFVLRQSFTEHVLSELNYPMHLYGGDNVLLWVIKNKLGMRLLNPCKYLKTYHSHCVDIHSSIRPRINIHGKSAWVPPSALL